MGTEQHALGLAVVVENDVEVVVPPRHHRLVTGKIAAADPRQAARELEDALVEVERRFDPTTPAGLGVTIGWGRPYFRDHVSHQAEVHLPFDRRARKPALIDAKNPENSLLFRKPTARTSHAGGQRILQSSPEEATLRSRLRPW